MNEEEYKRKRRLLSAKLIEARENAGLTQKLVEKRGFISQTELSKLENSSRRVDFLILLELAELYKKDISFLSLNKNSNIACS